MVCFPHFFPAQKVRLVFGILTYKIKNNYNLFKKKIKNERKEFL